MFDLWPLDLLLYVAVLLAPALAWRMADPAADPLLRWTLGTCAGLFVLPLVAWSVAVLLRTHITAAMLVALAVAVVAAGALIGRWRTKGHQP